GSKTGGTTKARAENMERGSDIIQLWDASTGKPVAKMSRPISDKNSANSRLGFRYKKFSHLAFSPDARLLLALADGGRVVIWDVANGEIKSHKPQNDGDFDRAFFTSDGKYICAVSRQGKVCLWEKDSLKLLAAHELRENMVEEHTSSILITN